jgi:solute carrier family 25 carnitine/acylcarnitine transporter 20/29|tara:strand:- start:1009 stop:1809 length:801 start_codon:yes stop_codon:yes gene_type:complete
MASRSDTYWSETLERSVISFASGFAYGATSVLVGQPLDVLKTRMQASRGTFSVSSYLATPSQWYRGSAPMLVGGALFRSAQFGFYGTTLDFVRTEYPSTYRIGGVLDWHVVIAGFAGGFGRGLVEGPFEYIKVRRIVDEPWRFRDMYSGSATTMLRNAFLFSSFVCYRDVLNHVWGDGTPGSALPPFWEGALCANAAWVSIWPLDVVKSQIQSGLHGKRGVASLLLEAVRSGKMFTGLVPGLMRSTIANGCGMTVYVAVEARLKAE